MKAMILAAGFGTRLRPLTFIKPKALMPVANRPLIDYGIKYLKSYGISEIVINAHHKSSELVKYFDHANYPGIKPEIRVERDILGTGGGIKNVEDFWDDRPFVVINGDIITNINLKSAIVAHDESGAMATLVVHDYPRFNQVTIDCDGYIEDFYPQPLEGGWAFTGIHIINPNVLDLIPRGRFSSIIDTYRKLKSKGGKIKAHISKGHYWRDLGTVRDYFMANKESLGGDKLLISPSAKLHSSVRLGQWVIIGNNAVVQQGVEIQESVIWDHTTVEKDARVVKSIITPECSIKID